MLDLIKKTILTGIGIASLTKDKIEELGKKLAEESKLSEEEGRKLINDLLKQSDEARKNLETQVEKLVKSTLERLDIPSKKEMDELKARIKNLEALNDK